MDTLQAIRERRSVKHFDPHHQFTREEELKLMDLAMQSPSSFNLQHWRIVNVKDKGLREQIRAVGLDQAQITESSLLYVICVDIKAWAKDSHLCWRNAPQAVQSLIIPWIQPFYEGKEQLQRDEAMRSAGLVSQTIMLAAKGMGYDSCPMIGFDAGKVADLISLPKDHAIGMMLAIGKAIKPAWPKPGFIDKEVLFIDNKFGADTIFDSNRYAGKSCQDIPAR